MGDDHAHAALDETLGFAEQADVGPWHTQCFVHAVEHQPATLETAVDHGTGTGRAQAGVDRQAEDGTGVQFELALVLRGERDEAGVVRACLLYTSPSPRDS